MDHPAISYHGYMQPTIEYPYKSSVRWAFCKWADIEDKAKPGYVYLRRLRVVQCPLFAIYLHFIYTPDSDRDPHNHPMNFWSWVLKGGYTEHRWSRPRRFRGDRVRPRWSLARTTMQDFHQIVKLDRSPTITLLFVGHRAQSWGFLTDDGYVDKADYGVPS